MRLLAHVRPDGSVDGFVVAPDGEVTGGLIPDDPTVQIYEVSEHGLGERIDPEKLAALHDEFDVKVTSANATLVPRKGEPGR
jgi:hypothetical protein